MRNGVDLPCVADEGPVHGARLAGTRYRTPTRRFCARLAGGRPWYSAT